MRGHEREQVQDLANQMQTDLDVYGIYLSKAARGPVVHVILRFGEVPLVFPPHMTRKVERVWHVPDEKREGPR